jgi:hypothetical protein
MQEDAENALDNYTEAKLRREVTVERQLEYAGILLEWGAVRDKQSEVDSMRFLMDILYSQMDRIEDEENRLLLQNDINKRQTEITKLNEALVK